jgi:hypothetical protein
MRPPSCPARSTPRALALLLLALLPARVHAQAVNHLYNKLQFGLQASDVIVRSDVRVDAEGSNGTDVDLADLGIGANRATWAAGALWRPGKRHEIGLGYVDTRQSGEKVLVDTISIGDTSFAAGLKKTKVGLVLGLGAIFFGLDVDGARRPVGERLAPRSGPAPRRDRAGGHRDAPDDLGRVGRVRPLPQVTCGTGVLPRGCDAVPLPPAPLGVEAGAVELVPLAGVAPAALPDARSSRPRRRPGTARRSA